jgi:predicted nucleic-acid-binding protein
MARGPDLIGIDTNVFLRYLVSDDNSEQRSAALRLMSERNVSDPAFINIVTLAETIWVLRKRLRYPWEQIQQAFALLLASGDFVFEEHDRLVVLMNQDQKLLADPADQLIAWANERGGCTRTFTFDKRAAKSVPGMELLT